MWMPRRPDSLRRVALRAAWRLALLVAGKLNGYGRTRPTRPKKPMVQRLNECETGREATGCGLGLLGYPTQTGPVRPGPRPPAMD
ncbi:hypothetical protein BDP55DRAFT_657352 [Colletotrichum godetiae]|uniref:Secreted protein n=1 Tax=Colletotrichum godetiae TaxID=1209918 RepID=A0AAJ0EV19_9PEZI|nr:uncharacterized protein BDP55DRAFT_657352 [Colletotrichum godetiae]KAK1688269.1 hypothetical protein BDP55DRAFT_657352 [Colletotrichum godetiae]